MATVSVVIVSWNSRDYLLNCLRSLKDHPEINETIVVDNASSDGTADALQHLGDHVTLIRSSSNLGFAAANNLGIVASTGQYIGLINPDVILQPHCFERLCLYMDHHPEAGLIGPKVLNEDGTVQHSFWPLPSLWERLNRAVGIHASQQDESLDRTVGVLSGCFWLTRRSALAEVGVLDERFFMYAEDSDLCKRFWDAGWTVVYVPDATAIHYGGKSSATIPVMSYVEMHRSNLLYWKKHHGWLGAVCVYLLMLLHQIVRLAAGGFLFLLPVASERRSLALVLQRSWACLRFLCAHPHKQAGYCDHQ